MLTLWLMIRLAGTLGHASAHGDHDSHGGWLGDAYIAVAKPVLKSRARAWTFLVLVGVATIISLGLIYTRHVTVKLLPFDNKTELQVVVDLPEGSSVEATDRVLQHVVGRLAAVPALHRSRNMGQFSAMLA